MVDEICCKEFDPAPWEDRVFEWQDKRFVKTTVQTLFYIPLGFGAVMRRLMKKIEAAGASTLDQVALSDHVTRWRMDLYLEVDRAVPGVENATLSGKYLSKVYEGPFKDTQTWCDDFAAVVADRQLNVAKLYMWYTTCPKCAKKYGKNYVVIIGRVE